MSVVEIMKFRLSEGVDQGEFLQADRRVQAEFAYHQPGLLRRTTARDTEGEWIVVDLWQSEAQAVACDQRWDSDPATATFRAMVDGSTVSTGRYVTLD